MADPLFFIDTNPDEVENKEEIATVDEDVLEDTLNAEKRRKRKEKERNLSKFLFGGASSDEGVDVEREAPDSPNASVESSAEDSEEDEEAEDDESGSEVDEGNQADMEADHEAKDNDSDENSADEEDDKEQMTDDSGDDSSDVDNEDTNVQDLLPGDLYGGALGLGGRSLKRKAAWTDEEDKRVLMKDVAKNYKKAPGKHGRDDTSTEVYGKTVERRFKNLVGEPAWAKLDRPHQDDDDSDDEFFRETTDMLDKKQGGTLNKEYLEFRKIKDMNYQTHTEGAVIRSTEFHPTSTVGLVAGLNGTASLFQIDGKDNPKIQTVNFKDFPVKTAKFSANNEVIVGSQHHSHMYSYDMIAGKINKLYIGKKIGEFNTAKFELSPDGKLIAIKGRFGAIHLLSARTKEYIGSLKMNDECHALAFSKSGGQLYTHGDGGEVYVWDVRERTCEKKFVDDGCISGSALAVNSNYLATGSSEGVVNLYNLHNINAANSHPTPEKVIMNLTTQINQLTFNPTGEMLAMSSELRDSAVKIVHFPSKSVFANFPTSKNIFRVNSVAFSPGGGYLSLGNNKGSANLYRLHHYKEY